MTELLFNNEALDLFENTRVPLNFRASLAESIGEYIANYSNSFDAPATDHNLGLLENANNVASNSRVPYQIVECKLLLNGRDLFGVSQLVVLEISEEAIRLAFIAGRGTARFAGSIRELDLSSHNFVYNSAQAAARANNTAGVLFAPVNYGVNFLTSQVDINYTHFSVYVLTLLQQMFDEAGVSVELLHPTSTLFQRLVLPVTEPKQLIAISPDFVAQRSADVGLGVGTTTIIFNTVVSGNLTGAYNTGTGVFTFGSPSKYNNACKVALRAALNGAIVTVGIVNLAGQGVSVTQVSDGVTDLEFDLSLQGEAVFAATTWRVQVTSPSIAVTIRAGSRFGVDVLEDFVEGQTIDVARSLPEMTQGELFTQVAQISNLIATTRNGVVRLMAFDRLSVSDRIDWSSRLDTSRPSNILFQSRFGRSTYFRYSNDAFSPSPTAGEALVKFSNEVLPPTADAVVLKFAGAIDTTMAGAILSILVPLYEIAYRDGAGTAARNGGGGSVSIIFTDPHGLKVGDYIYIGEVPATYYVTAVNSTTLVTVLNLSGGGLPNFSGSAWQVIGISARPIGPRLGFVPPASSTRAVTYRGRSGLTVVNTFRQVLFTGTVGDPEGLGWDKLLKNYFILWLGAMDRFQLVRAYLKLTDDDAYQFDFTQTVYVEKFGSLFYVQGINQYDGEEDSTEVEMLALAEGFDTTKIIAL